MTIGVIERDPARAADRPHDLIVIGGGIYGAAVTLQAALRGLRPLLLERDDFGSATSAASLRIIHGGLRYLQSLDLRRARESAREQAWFLDTFPELVRPLPCLMPLDGLSLRRPGPFRCAVRAAALLGARAAPADSPFPPPGAIDPRQTLRHFPAAEPRTLRAGAVWYDALMLSPERLLIEIIRWACARGATALNYVEATSLLTRGGAAAGVHARDRIGGDTLLFRAPLVINCAGPWCRQVAARLDRDAPALFRPSLAFNLLLDVEPPSPMAVGVTRPDAPGRAYFLVPCHGRLLAGTFHAPCDHQRFHPDPTDTQIRAFLDDLNAAVPTLKLAPRHILTVLAGLLPADRDGSPKQATRPILLHHATIDGPPGLWSVSGVKYTTARAVAERILRLALPSTRPASAPRIHDRPPGHEERARDLLSPSGPAQTPDAARRLRALVAEEAVLHLDDLVLRRSCWGLVPELALAAGRRAADLLGWDEQRCASEFLRLERALGVTTAPARPPIPADAMRSRAAARGGPR